VVFGYNAVEKRPASELNFEFVITIKNFITLGVGLVGGNFVEMAA